jgi:hypothetical protein
MSSFPLSISTFLAGAIRTIFALLLWGAPLLGYSAFAVDPIGTATLTKLNSCPAGGLPNGTCYKVTISNCPESRRNFVAAIKMNIPPGAQKPLGTVFFTTGGGGKGYYDEKFASRDTRCNAQGNCGLLAVQTVNDAGYATVQTNFSDPDNLASEPVGWLTGPAADGPRALACRYATLVHVVWTNILRSNTTRPVCATGNSGGSAVIAYGLTQYGLGSLSSPGPLLSMVEATSGPPMARIDHGCQKVPPKMTVTCPSGTVLSEGYGLGLALQFIDPAYDGDQETTPDLADPCAQQIENGGNRTLFLHDSVVSNDFAAPNYPRTFVNVVFGDQDQSSAVPQGLEWYNAITSSKAQSCVAGAPHALPSTFEGATQVANDLISLCKLQ